MNDEREKFKASLKVLQGGDKGRENLEIDIPIGRPQIDIPLEDKKKEKKEKDTFESLEDTLARYKEVVKEGSLKLGKYNSFVDDEIVEQLEAAVEKFKKADEETKKIEEKIENAKKEINSNAEYKLEKLYSAQLLAKMNLKNAGKEFEEILKIYKNQVQANSVKILSREDPLAVPEFVNQHNNKQSIAKPKIEKKHNQKYTSPKKEKKKMKRLKKVATIGSAIVLVLGGIEVGQYIINKNKDKPINIQTAQESGKTLEQMGISDKTAKTILELNKKVQQDPSEMTRKEINKMAIDNYQISQDLLREKLSNVLKVDKDDIEVGTTKRDTRNERSAYINIGDSMKYTYTNFIDDTMQSEIGEYIFNIEENRDLLNELSNKSCTNEEALEKIEEFVDEESRLAGGYDLYVENDKIKANITRNSDIKKQKEQEQNRKQKLTQANTKDLTDEER